MAQSLTGGAYPICCCPYPPSYAAGRATLTASPSPLPPPPSARLGLPSVAPAGHRGPPTSPARLPRNPSQPSPWPRLPSSAASPPCAFSHFHCVRGAAAGAGSGGRERVDDGAGVRGLGHEERRAAGLLHGLLQDPRDAQTEQEGALPRQPRRRRRPPRPPAAQARPGRGPAQARQRPSPAALRPRRLSNVVGTRMGWKSDLAGQLKDDGSGDMSAAVGYEEGSEEEEPYEREFYDEDDEPQDVESCHDPVPKEEEPFEVELCNEEGSGEDSFHAEPFIDPVCNACNTRRKQLYEVGPCYDLVAHEGEFTEKKSSVVQAFKKEQNKQELKRVLRKGSINKQKEVLVTDEMEMKPFKKTIFCQVCC